MESINSFTKNGFNKDTDLIMVCGGSDMNYECRDYFEKLGFIEGNLGEPKRFCVGTSICRLNENRLDIKTDYKKIRRGSLYLLTT